MSDAATKRCGRCGRTRPVDEDFYKFKDHATGKVSLDSYCKRCRLIGNRLHYKYKPRSEMTPERIQEVRAMQRAYYRRHRETLSVAHRAYDRSRLGRLRKMLCYRRGKLARLEAAEPTPKALGDIERLRREMAELEVMRDKINADKAERARLIDQSYNPPAETKRRAKPRGGPDVSVPVSDPTP